MSDRSEALKWRMRAEQLEVALERVVNEAELDVLASGTRNYIIEDELYQAVAEALA